MLYVTCNQSLTSSPRPFTQMIRCTFALLCSCDITILVSLGSSTLSLIIAACRTYLSDCNGISSNAGSTVTAASSFELNRYSLRQRSIFLFSQTTINRPSPSRLSPPGVMSIGKTVCESSTYRTMSLGWAGWPTPYRPYRSDMYRQPRLSSATMSVGQLRSPTSIRPRKLNGASETHTH